MQLLPARAAMKPILVDELAPLNVGEFKVMPYGQAKSAVTLARALKDGRRWSLVPCTEETGHPGEFEVWRRA